MSGRQSFEDRLHKAEDEIKARQEALRRQQENTDAAVVTLALLCILGWLFWLTYKLAKAGLL